MTSKPLPKQVINSSAATATSDTQAASGLDQEAENQFELELCWCIQQLDLSLRSGKLSEKQSLDVTKTINLLSSNATSLIRKRQAMRNSLGDYRAKMELEERQHGRYISNVKFSAPKINNSNKCVFLRKVNGTDKTETDITEEKDEKKIFVMSKEPSDVPFKFNFSQSE